MAKEHVDWVEKQLMQLDLARHSTGSCPELEKLEETLIFDVLPKMALLPPETRVLKRNGRETRLNIDEKPCTLEEWSWSMASATRSRAASLETRTLSRGGRSR